jgi:hypothetical protein
MGVLVTAGIAVGVDVASAVAVASGVGQLVGETFRATLVAVAGVSTDVGVS